MMMTMQKFLEREIIKTAKELNIKDKYINIILNELKALWIVSNSVKEIIILIGEKAQKENGKKKIVQIKAVREYKKDAIKKMERLTQLFRLYKALKEVDDLSQTLFIGQQTEQEKEVLTTSKV